MIFCRSIQVELGLVDHKSKVIYELCDFSLGISGPVDPESGMILNLVTIDEILRDWKKDFEKRNLTAYADFFKECRDFVSARLIQHQVNLTALAVRSSRGLYEWAPSGGQDEFRVHRQKRATVREKDGTLHKRRFQVSWKVKNPDQEFHVSEQLVAGLWELRDADKAPRPSEPGLLRWGYFDEDLQAFRFYEF